MQMRSVTISNLPIRVLYVEDSAIQARSGARAVRHIGGELVLAATGAAALEAAQSQTFDVIVFDLGLPDMNGFEVFQHLRRQFPTIPLLLVTGFSPPVCANAV